MTNFKSIGRSTPLTDGQEKVTGRLRYAPDLEIPGMLYARFVTSPYAHARLDRVDKTVAMAVPGVVAVLTAGDLPDVAPTVRSRLLLARERVIFAGQPVALVLAETPGAAQDAAEQVWVDYTPLPAAVTIAEARAETAPLVWPYGLPGESGEAGAHGADVGEDEEETKPSNIARHNTFVRGNIAAGFAAADVVVEREFTTSMVHQSYLETLCMVVQPDPMGSGATVWTSTQAPFHVRLHVAEVLGVDETAVRVVPMLPGGAFGAKFLTYELLVALAAQKMNRAVRLVLTRAEDMLASNPAPAARLKVKLGATADGAFTALRSDIIFDAGCYPSPHGISAFLLGSLYKVPHIDVHYTEVMTFKLSVAAFRAPGAPQAAFALESVVDEMAERLAIDPLALRMQNAVEPGDPMADGRPWPAMGFRQVLKAAAAHPLWQARAEIRASGHGVGLAMGGWPGGVEPMAASCQLHRDGTLHVHIGAVDLTGTPTGMKLIAAEAYGIDPEHVRVVIGDTSVAAYAGAAGGSKITYALGPAVIKAAQEARVQTLAIVAEELEADPADLEIVQNRVEVRGVPDRAMDLGQVAGLTMQFGGKYAPVVGNGRHAETRPSPAFCAQLAEVAVDRETGEVQVGRLVVIQDVGRAINPLMVRGQMTGGAMQGLGWALYERMVHDELGTPLTGSWLDYTVPHFSQAVPRFETVIVEVPSEHGPYGARGVGEPPVIATAAAVANAIHNCCRARVSDLPMTAPRVLAALRTATGQG